MHASLEVHLDRGVWKCLVSSTSRIFNWLSPFGHRRIAHEISVVSTQRASSLLKKQVAEAMLCEYRLRLYVDVHLILFQRQFALRIYDTYESHRSEHETKCQITVDHVLSAVRIFRHSLRLRSLFFVDRVVSHSLSCPRVSR